MSEDIQKFRYWRRTNKHAHLRVSKTEISDLEIFDIENTRILPNENAKFQTLNSKNPATSTQNIITSTQNAIIFSNNAIIEMMALLWQINL